MIKPHKKFKNQIRAARSRMAFALNEAGFPDVKKNGSIRRNCELYSQVFNVPLSKNIKHWHLHFLLEQYGSATSKMSKEVKVPKKVNRRSEYNRYIKSFAWFEFSSRIKAERGNKCEECGAGGKGVILHSHHLTYDRLGKELPEDIQVLCKPCHQLKHPEKKMG
jgi:hypothetical protein